MRAVLVPLAPHREEFDLLEQYVIGESEVHIGRAKDSGVHLNVRSVSRKHATLRHRNGRWTITNHSTPNPVRVNGICFDHSRLRSGDRVQVGEIMMTFEDLEESSRESVVERDLDTPFNSTLGEAEDHHSRRLRMLLEGLLEFLRPSPELDNALEVFRHLKRVVAEVIAGDQILIARLEGDRLWADDEEIDNYSSTVLHRCRATNRSLLWRNEDEVNPSQSIHGYGIRSAICTPLASSRGQVLAYLYMHRTSMASFGEEDLELLRAFARVAGTVVENTLLRHELQEEVQQLRDKVSGDFEVHITGDKMSVLLAECKRLAATNATVLLLGDTGTGKEVFARVIHRASKRADEAFVAVNCAAIPENLLESELFGLAPKSGVANAPPEGRRGSFELAEKGTLFLDEIGDLPLHLQSKLLRVIEVHEVKRVGAESPMLVDFRLLCATHQSLHQMVQDGRFRGDLYHRIHAQVVYLPPLRERLDEIRPLAEHFARHYFSLRSLRKLPDPLFSEACVSRLLGYSWPGNVRELRNVVEGAVIRAESATIQPRHLRLNDGSETTGLRERLESLEDVEKRHIRKVLRATGGNKKRAAEVLGIHRNTLTQKLQRLDDDGASGDA